MGEATALNQSLTKYNPLVIIQAMVTVFYHDDFADELLQFDEDVQIETEAMVDLLEEWGPARFCGCGFLSDLVCA